MNPQDAVDLGREALTECLIIGSPILIAGLVIGLVIGMLQAMTQVHDQTVSFVPKVLGMCVIIALALPWLAERMIDYTRHSLENPVINVNETFSANGSRTGYPANERLSPIEPQNGFAPNTFAPDPPSNPLNDSVATRVSFQSAETTDEVQSEKSMPVLQADNVADPMPMMSSRFEDSMPVLRR